MSALSVLCLIVARMDRQRQEEERKNRSSKKGVEAEQSILNRVCVLSRDVKIA